MNDLQLAAREQRSDLELSVEDKGCCIFNEQWDKLRPSKKK